MRLKIEEMSYFTSKLLVFIFIFDYFLDFFEFFFVLLVGFSDGLKRLVIVQRTFEVKSAQKLPVPRI
jgi:hypothetical protein